MPSGPIKRAQLIAPFGVGAMLIVRDGTSLIAAGLDHWYEREDGRDDVDKSEFRVDEWRLAQQLEVDHFRQPPDYRKTNRRESVPNAYLTVPFLRFPQWHFCPSCDRLKPLPLTVRGQVKCNECEMQKKTRFLVQVPIIAICDHGHIQDFPWGEWVHRSVNPTCQKSMRLFGTGSATLAGLIVKCECGERRSLGGILGSSDPVLLCRGKRPWLGTEESEKCDRPLRGSQRSASNVYYSQVRSAIYLRRGNNSELISLLEEPPLSSLINKLSSAGVAVTSEFLRELYPQVLQRFSNKDIQACLDIILLEGNADQDIVNVEGDDLQSSFRRPEFNVLRTERNENNLKIRVIDINQYKSDIARYFSRIALVDKLRETRALAGFTRIFPETEQTLDSLKALLRCQPQPRQDSWLPAYVVYGEGIFIELKEERLRGWLDKHGDEVHQRIATLVKNYEEVKEERKLRERPLTPRFILLHTFAHLLMNRLTFECGYSSAALRERLYVSDNPDAPMAGILIYTAAGDSEGTMGGLVRIGKPVNFEPMVRAALEAASWCSADPVCMEVGKRGGQGPDSCNLAACHNCALVPETGN